MGTTDVRIEPATGAHALELASTIRLDDAREVQAAGFPSVEEALAATFDLPGQAWTLLFGGQVAAMFGVTEQPGLTEGRVFWVLTGALVYSHPMTFARVSRHVLEILVTRHKSLVNWVDTRYEKSIRWLEWLGCQLGEPVLFPSGVWFRPVVVRR